MNGLALAFTLVNALALLVLPRRWAPLPLLIGACYMTQGIAINVGPFAFTVIRVLVLAGFIRVMVRGERPAGRLNLLDGLLVVWGMWALLSSAFHKPIGEALVFRLGLTYNILGVYFLLRCFCHSLDDLVQLIKVLAILLLPVALEMVQEQLTRQNMFAVFNGSSGVVPERNGRLRSSGPFGHSILAGTVGAACAPLMLGIWRRDPVLAKIGLGACLTMVATSNSSGPLMTLVFSMFAVLLWRWRQFTTQMRLAAVVGYIFLELVMEAPAYYLIARIDLTGGSTGWHRAKLIESSFDHLDEWWLGGTDYTRHWMTTGVSWSPDHVDITNYYIKMGVWGGLPLMLLFIAILWRGFRYVGEAIRALPETAKSDQFLIWTMGASLFAHAATSISVSYFDQSFLFVYLSLAIIGSLWAGLRSQELPETVPVVEASSWPEGVMVPPGRSPARPGGPDSLRPIR